MKHVFILMDVSFVGWWTKFGSALESRLTIFMLYVFYILYILYVFYVSYVLYVFYVLYILYVFYVLNVFHVLYVLNVFYVFYVLYVSMFCMFCMFSIFSMLSFLCLCFCDHVLCDTNSFHGDILEFQDEMLLEQNTFAWRFWLSLKTFSMETFSKVNLSL